MSFAEEFRNMRLENLLSQETIAHKIGTTFGTVNRWEAGKTLPAFSVMSVIMDFCDEVGYDREAMFGEWRKDKEARAGRK